jgi:methylated-DNA-protein-cysteine methyltransferase related protein
MPTARRAGEYAPLTKRVISIIRRIPRGRVATYAQVAGVAGSPQAARQVVRVLHSLSRREKLPWHRVIGSQGRIRLPPGAGFETQQRLLRREGVAVDERGAIRLDAYLWVPRLGRLP